MKVKLRLDRKLDIKNTLKKGKNSSHKANSERSSRLVSPKSQLNSSSVKTQRIHSKSYLNKQPGLQLPANNDSLRDSKNNFRIRQSSRSSSSKNENKSRSKKNIEADFDSFSPLITDSNKRNSMMLKRSTIQKLSEDPKSLFKKSFEMSQFQYQKIKNNMQIGVYKNSYKDSSDLNSPFHLSSMEINEEADTVKLTDKIYSIDDLNDSMIQQVIHGPNI